MDEQNERVAPEDLPDISTYTITQLKELGTARRYSTIWLKAKPKRADYIDWITEQHQKKVEAFNQPDPFRAMVTVMRENIAQITVAREKAAVAKEEAAAIRAETETKLAAYMDTITKLRAQPEKTTIMYDKLLDMYEIVIKLKDMQIILAKSPI
jgi:hypothetical protein